jgi:hypothetical protein
LFLQKQNSYRNKTKARRDARGSRRKRSSRFEPFRCRYHARDLAVPISKENAAFVHKKTRRALLSKLKQARKLCGLDGLGKGFLPQRHFEREGLVPPTGPGERFALKDHHHRPSSTNIIDKQTRLPPRLSRPNALIQTEHASIF